MYHDSDGDGIVEVCATVLDPSIDCPVAFAFSILLFTTDGITVIHLDVLLFGPDLGSNPEIPFASCAKRSCMDIGIGSFSVHLERSPSLDSRITLCADEGSLFNGMDCYYKHFMELRGVGMQKQVQQETA